jgi:hypothetical protein
VQFLEYATPPKPRSPRKLFDSIENVQAKTTQIAKKSNEFFRPWLTFELRCQIDFSSSESSKLL